MPRNEAFLVKMTIEDLVRGTQVDRQECTERPAVHVAKNAKYPLNQLVRSRYFAVIVLGASQVCLERVEGMLKNIISRKSECTRRSVLRVETHVKYPLDLPAENQFTVVTVFGRVIKREAGVLNSLRNSSR